MKRLLLTTLVTLLFVLSCEESSETVPDPFVADYEVYSAFLETDYIRFSKVVLHAESYDGLVMIGLSDEGIERDKAGYPMFPSTLFDELKEVYQDSLIYQDRFIVNSKELIVENFEDYNTNVPPNPGSFSQYWINFFDFYGEEAGRVALSRIAFNETKDQAFFMATDFVRAGTGSYIYMKKGSNGWFIEESAAVFAIN